MIHRSMQLFLAMIKTAAPVARPRHPSACRARESSLLRCTGGVDWTFSAVGGYLEAIGKHVFCWSGLHGFQQPKKTHEIKTGMRCGEVKPMLSAKQTLCMLAKGIRDTKTLQTDIISVLQWQGPRCVPCLSGCAACRRTTVITTT